MIYIIIILVLFLIYIIFFVNENFAITNITTAYNLKTNNVYVIQNTSSESQKFSNYLINQNANECTLNISFGLLTNVSNGQELFKLSGNYVDNNSIINVLEIFFTQTGGFQINTNYSSEVFTTKSYYLLNKIIYILITIKGMILKISISDNSSFNYIETFYTSYPLNSGKDYNINSITWGSYYNTLSNPMSIFNINLFFVTSDIYYNLLQNIQSIKPKFLDNGIFDINKIVYYYVFKTNTNITVPFNCTLNYLCVGGGGGAVGGGGGGFATDTVSISSGTNITITVGKGGAVKSQGDNSSILFTNYSAIATGGYQNNGDSIINNVTISGYKVGNRKNDIRGPDDCIALCPKNMGRECKLPRVCTILNSSDLGGGGGSGSNGSDITCTQDCNYGKIAGGQGGSGKLWTNCYIPSLRNFYWGGGGSKFSSGGLGGGGGITANGGNTNKSTVFSGDIGSVHGGANTGGGGGGTTGIGGDGIVILIFY
jgi:hypothetical protein